MAKLKEKIYDLFIILKKSIEKFPLTISSIIILTLIYAINLDNNFISRKILENISLFVPIFASSAFLIETLLDNNAKKRIPYYCLSAILGGLIVWGANTNKDIFGMENKVFEFRLERFAICYLIVVLLLGIYYNYKKSNLTFKKYVIKTFINLFKTSLIYGIFAIGLALITTIFVYLILGGHEYILILRIEILLLGLYYFPRIVYDFYSQNGEAGKFAKIVIKYVLGTLVMIAFAIIYLYIAKIIILRDMPSNQIFRILTVLFAIGLPIWTMVSAFEEDGIFDKINNKLPLLFIPFIILQIYAIGVRIANNGITVSRYLCIMVIVFEIIYTIIYIKNKEKIGASLLVLAILMVVSTLVPYVNMFKVSDLSQYNNLRIYTKKQELSDEDVIKISGGYNYLKRSTEGKKYITEADKAFVEKSLKEKDKNGILSASPSRDNKEYFYANKRADNIDIQGYKTLYNVDASESSVNNTIDQTFSAAIFETNSANGNRKFKFDILDKIKDYMKHEEDINEYFQNNNEIILDDGRKLILTMFIMEYDKATEEIAYYNISGYLLEP